MFKWLLPTLVAVTVGLIVLVGALLPASPAGTLRTDLLQWATVVGAFALIVAYFSILRVHLGRVTSKSKHKIASLLIIISALATALLVIIQGPEGTWPRQIVNAILIPGESALLILTAFTLVITGVRAFRVRRTAGTAVFLLAALVALATAVPYTQIERVESFIAPVMAASTAGIRGLLLGVALGTTLTGIRLLTGVDRPHSEE